MLRALLLIVMLVGFVGIGAVAWIGLQPDAVTEAAVAPVAPVVVVPPQRATILVAARTLRAGSLLRPEDLMGVNMLASAVPSDARVESRETRGAIQGALLRRSLREGDMILDQDVVLPGDRGYLAASLSPNMRAMPIAVDQVNGAAGLIWPGDRVDVMLTQQVPREEAALLSRRTSGEIVAQDVRVIAVDQNLVQGAIGEAGEGFRAARVVTLEVSVPQAERLSVARRLGLLSLILRPAQDAAEDVAQSEAGVTWGGDASSALRQTQIVPGPASVIHIFTGVRPREETRF
jgi:pilus assembly protein CpaB